MVDAIDPRAGLRRAESDGFLIQGCEGRHGRPNTWHDIPAPALFTCEPHEYRAVMVIPQEGWIPTPENVAKLPKPIRDCIRAETPKGPTAAMRPAPATPAAEELAALDRLIAIAQTDTGQARRVAAFLLAWWNADNCGGFDLTDLWAVDTVIAVDMLRVFALVGRVQYYPDSLGYGDRFGDRRGSGVRTWSEVMTMRKELRVDPRTFGKTHRARMLAAKTAHHEALAKHNTTLTDGDIAAELVSFMAHLDFCESASHDALEHAVLFIGGNIAIAQLDYDTNPRSTRYVDVRKPYLEYAQDALARRFPSPLVDLVQHLARQREFSLRTFGPGDRAAGVIDHIRKELREIEAAPGDVSEWIDVAILAFDGAMRAGATPRRSPRRCWPSRRRTRRAPGRIGSRSPPTRRSSTTAPERRDERAEEHYKVEHDQLFDVWVLLEVDHSVLTRNSRPLSTPSGLTPTCD